ncbi:MAG: hypothetical protein K6A92_12085, partial [Lachnospiraceae bacterium]|nr:hypothetical protein [Lachnospiraceae bacterium]
LSSALSISGIPDNTRSNAAIPTTSYCIYSHTKEKAKSANISVSSFASVFTIAHSFSFNTLFHNRMQAWYEYNYR